MVLSTVLSMLFLTHCHEMMTGGISRLDLKDEDTREVIKKGIGIILERLQRKDSSHVLYQPICVQASSQVVEGIEYRVAMEIAPEDSAPRRGIDFDCIPEAGRSPLAKRDKKFVCFSIWQRPWKAEPESFKVKLEENETDVQSCLDVNN